MLLFSFIIIIIIVRQRCRWASKGSYKPWLKRFHDYARIFPWLNSISPWSQFPLWLVQSVICRPFTRWFMKLTLLLYDQNFPFCLIKNILRSSFTILLHKTRCEVDLASLPTFWVKIPNNLFFRCCCFVFEFHYFSPTTKKSMTFPGLEIYISNFRIFCFPWPVWTPASQSPTWQSNIP